MCYITSAPPYSRHDAPNFKSCTAASRSAISLQLNKISTRIARNHIEFLFNGHLDPPCTLLHLISPEAYHHLKNACPQESRNPACAPDPAPGLLRLDLPHLNIRRECQCSPQCCYVRGTYESRLDHIMSEFSTSTKNSSERDADKTLVRRPPSLSSTLNGVRCSCPASKTSCTVYPCTTPTTLLLS